MKKRNNEICLNTKYKNKVLYSKKFSLISVIILILCFTLILPGCGNNEPSKTVVGGDGYYNDDQNVDNNQDVNQNEYENEEDEENSYVGIWVTKPIYRYGTVYSEVVKISSYENDTVEFEHKEYVGNINSDYEDGWDVFNWEELKASRSHGTSEIEKAHIGHGIPCFDLQNTNSLHSGTIYIDDNLLYFNEYGNEEFLMYPSDFTSIDTCLAFLNIVYKHYHYSYSDGLELENNNTVSDYTEEDFIPDFDWKQITVDMIKDSATSIYKQIENTVKKDKKKYGVDEIYSVYFTFSAEKNFSGDIKDLNITVWAGYSYEDPNYDLEGDYMIYRYVKATGTFDGITKIEYSDEDFKWTDSLDKELDSYYSITNGTVEEYDNYRDEYIHVEDDTKDLMFKENGDLLDYIYKYNY